MGAIARKYNMYVIAPIYGILVGIPCNTALLFDRAGRLIGEYCKVHCTEQERSLGIVPGDSWPVFQLDFGAIGIMICHDNSFPESASCLVLNGAEVIFWAHVIAGWGDVFMDILFRAPAVHNGIHFVPVCYGCDTGLAHRTGQMMIGRSSIIGPDATILADAGRYRGIAFTTIDLDQPRLAYWFTREGDYVYNLDMLRDRRPDTYGCLLRTTPPIQPLPGRDLEQYPER